jgi:catechol 2,3-dioxygenase
VKDPWGSYAEYSADIDYISADHDWVSKDHPEEDGIYVWGPAMPADFIHNYEADQ